MPATSERELAEAVAGMTVEDFEYLQEHGLIEKPVPPAEPSKPDTPVTVTQKDDSEPDTQLDTQPESEPDNQEQEPKPRRKRKRRTINHEWPEVGAVLEADYAGEHYEAKVIAARKYKSGKALRLLNGPAVGQTHHSFTGAMLAATEKQRDEQGLGRKGVSNGWGFWKVREGGDP
jgi:hypothetical protein